VSQLILPIARAEAQPPHKLYQGRVHVVEPQLKQGFLALLFDALRDALLRFIYLLFDLGRVNAPIF
jgi:hypothetical protein